MKRVRSFEAYRSCCIRFGKKSLALKAKAIGDNRPVAKTKPSSLMIDSVSCDILNILVSHQDQNADLKTENGGSGI